jgi:hypothetical protein
MKLHFPFIYLFIFLTSCIGIDEVEDPIVGAFIETDQVQIAMLLDDSVMVSGTYHNQYGIPQSTSILWEAANPNIAVADEAGSVLGVGLGQTNVFGYVGDTQSEPILATVVATTTEVAMISVSSDQGVQIGIDQTSQMTAVVTNLNDEVLTGESVMWFSSDTSVFTIDSNGLLTGKSTGFAQAYAMVNGLESNRLGIRVGATSRTGNFQPLGGYDAFGSVELSIGQNGDLLLALGSNFQTSFALGTYIYLSNTTNGSQTATGGLEVSEITTGGAALFNVSDVDPNVRIDDYNYVIILCKPASLSFGFAELD